jgi:hypothetical protein
MGDPFDAIGFTIRDDATFHHLAEEVHHRGVPSYITRNSSILRGFCWQIGSGLEVWTVLHETKDGVYYADCRPAFRGTRLFRLSPWQITEFDEDGEALVSGHTSAVDLIFELQNFTELDHSVYNQSALTAHISGLAYRAKISEAKSSDRLFALSLTEGSRSSCQFAENDYLVNGQIIAWRELTNPLTNASLLWFDVQSAQLSLELLVSREQCKGTPREGDWISAESWLQGYLISPQEQQTKYEGLDFSFPPAEYWSTLRREN